MLTARRIIVSRAALVAIGMVGLAALWFVFFRDDAPPPVTIDAAVASVASLASDASAPTGASARAVLLKATPADGTPGDAAPTAATPTELTPVEAPTDAAVEATETATEAPSSTPVAAPTEPGGLAGTWVLSSQGDSFLGYRVREELARLGFNTAVGRTSAVTGSLTYDGQAITALTVVADMTQLVSDDPRREKHLRGKSLETNIFKTATFVLAAPIAVRGLEDGERMNATAIGDLTIHGVTRRVAIDLQGQLTNGLVVIVGSLEIQFADYDIDTPASGLVLSVEDHGIMELQLVFERA